VLNDDGTNDAIKGDVKPGDKVVTEGQLRVVPGAKVAIQKGKASPPPPPIPTCRHEHLPHLYRTARPDHPDDGGAGDLRPVRLFHLPVSELPAVDFPTITVSASLPGADPETMASPWRRRWRTSSPPSPASAR
jgi:hypothetical protein